MSRTSLVPRSVFTLLVPIVFALAIAGCAGPEVTATPPEQFAGSPVSAVAGFSCVRGRAWYLAEGSSLVSARGYFFSTSYTWSRILAGSQTGPYYLLARQYIAARLTASSSGQPLPQSVSDALAGSEGFFTGRALGSSAGIQTAILTGWTGVLDDFNSGRVAGWPVCSAGVGCSKPSSWYLEGEGSPQVSSSGYFFGTSYTWTRILSGTQPGPYYQLARAYIPARLSQVSSGSMPPAAVEAALAGAGMFFTGRALGSSAGIRTDILYSWANVLDSFNNGGFASSSWPACQGAAPPSLGVVTLDTLVRYQVMRGWEANAQSGQDEPGFSGWSSSLFDKAASELGINRIRLEVKSGSESNLDYYARALAGQSSDPRCERYTTVNDNSDSNVLNMSGFHFSDLDNTVTKVVNPLRARLAARGERLYVNLNYVSFFHQCSNLPPFVHGDPQEYAEFMLAVFTHMRDAYGFVPDAIEVILEPDNNIPEWTGDLIGRAIQAAAGRLAGAGFATPDFIAPSTAVLSNAVGYAGAAFQVPGVSSLIKEISYHRYGGVSDANLLAIAQFAASKGVSTSMLEHIGSDVEDLYKDVTIANGSAWQQYTLGFPGTGDGGGTYYPITNGVPSMGSRTRYLRQYFYYVRMGATRVKAQSSSASLRPVGFQNVGGKPVVVVHVDAAGTLDVSGLRPGIYGANITTASASGLEIAGGTVFYGGKLRISAPAPGVVAVYVK